LFGNANRDKLPDDASDEAKKGVDITALKLGLFGKLPIAMGGFTLFPMLGVDGQIFLGGSIGGDAVTEPEDKIGWQDHINQVWFKLGVGADFDLPTESGKLFLRPELLYGLRLNTYTESVDIKAQKDAKTPSYNGIIGHGLDVRVAIGYRF
jgi:hypothetical protein